MQCLLLTEQNNKCNASDEVKDGMLRKYCQESLSPHHSRDLQDSNCAKECQLNRAETREVKGQLL